MSWSLNPENIRLPNSTTFSAEDAIQLLDEAEEDMMEVF